MTFTTRHQRSARGLAAALTLALFIVIAAPAAAFHQAGADGAPGAPPADTTTATQVDPVTIDLVSFDPVTIPMEELRIRLRPMRQEQLEAEAARYLELIQARAEQAAQLDLAARAATGRQQEELVQRSTALKSEQAALIDRARLVLALLEIRGGDVKTDRAYIDSLGGGLLDDLRGITSGDRNAFSVAWQAFRTWLVSAEGGWALLRNLALFFATLIVAWFVARIVSRILRRSLSRFSGTSALLRDFLASITSKVIMVIGLIVAISMLGFDITPLAAAIGAAGLVIGLALQGTLSNFASGILILLYRPFDIGDVIEAGGTAGKVEAMNMLTSTVVSGDNRRIIVPNNAIWNGTIINVTGKPTRRVDLTFSIAYGDDVERAQAVLEDMVRRHPLVLTDPAPTVRLHELGESSVNFIVRPWVKTADYWTVYWDLTRDIKKRFDAESITIPFPQRDVHLHYADASRPRETAATG